MGSMNKVILIGNVGDQPVIRTFQNGGRIAHFSIATSEAWKDKATGEKRERTDWHRVAVTNDKLVSLLENFVKKGDKISVEGKLETREYLKDGQKHYSTEIVLRPFRGSLTLLSGKKAAPDNDDEAAAPNMPSAAQFDAMAPAPL